MRNAVNYKFFLDKDTAADSPTTFVTKLVETEHLLEELREKGKRAEEDGTGAAQHRQASHLPHH